GPPFCAAARCPLASLCFLPLPLQPGGLIFRSALLPVPSNPAVAVPLTYVAGLSRVSPPNQMGPRSNANPWTRGDGGRDRTAFARAAPPSEASSTSPPARSAASRVLCDA